MLFGNRMGGVVCGIAAVIGISLPPLVILSILTFFYGALKDNQYFDRAFIGIRAAVVPIIAAAAFKLCKSAFRHWHGYAIALVAFGLSLFTIVNNFVIVLFGAVAGLVLAGRNDHDPA
jgi:chromate transporter